ncbi:DUF4097 family beta strand repeat protein [Candidatus Dojkabacteria bacterium]|nr:DUF4097 family beta strand repeat protein [Candidatus Dojkabacteria bacterium]
MVKKEGLGPKVSQKIKKSITSFTYKEFDLVKLFKFTKEAKVSLQSYFKELAVIRTNYTTEEYEDITSSIKEHFYVVLNEYRKKSKKEPIGKDKVEKIINDLGDPKEFIEEKGGEKLEKTIRREKFHKIALKAVWVIIKYSFLILLFICIYLPIILTLLSVAIGGFFASLIWIVNPTNFFGEQIIVTSSLGVLTPIFGVGLTFLATGLCILILNLIGRIHWKRPLLKLRCLTFLIILFGIVITFGTFITFFILNRKEEVSSESFKEELNGIDTLVVDEIFDDLEIVGDQSLEDEISIQIEKSATGYDSRDAFNNLESIDFSIEKIENEIFISSFYNESLRSMYHFEDLNITIKVPRNLKVKFNSEKEDDSRKIFLMLALHDISSKIKVKNITTDLDISYSFGNLEFENITNDEFRLDHKFGNTKVKNLKTNDLLIQKESGSTLLEEINVRKDCVLNSKFGSIEAKTVTAESVQIDSNSGSIELAGIDARLSLNSKYSSIQIDNVTGDTYIDSSSGAIEIINLVGDLTIETKYGSTSVNDIRGKLIVNSSGGSIEIGNMKGSVDIKNKYGSIEVDFEEVTKRSQNFITNSSGSVYVALPQEAYPEVRVSSDYGSVSNDFSKESVRDDSPIFDIEVEYGGAEIDRK